jgi:hypothetical protein
LLLFQAWNIATARKRGKIFVSLETYSRERNPKDFRIAYLLNIGWFVIIAIVTFIYIGNHFGFKFTAIPRGGPHPLDRKAQKLS